LQESIEDFFTVAAGGNFAAVSHDFLEEVNKDHGRLVVRRYRVREDVRTLADTAPWDRATSHTHPGAQGRRGHGVQHFATIPPSFSTLREHSANLFNAS
jgi:hypothetical protein